MLHLRSFASLGMNKHNGAELLGRVAVRIGKGVKVDDEVTLWIDRLKTGDARAPQVIWERYFEQLIRLAQRKLTTTPKRGADEEDVVLSAFNSFFRGVEAGRFPKLDDREDLWKLLVTLTVRKARAQRRRSAAQKRGAGRVRGESVFEGNDGSENRFGIDQFLGSHPTPEAAAMVAETVVQLLDTLGDESLKEIANLKMEGYTNEEVAKKLKCVPRTVGRKLDRIRNIWSRVEWD